MCTHIYVCIVDLRRLHIDVGYITMMYVCTTSMYVGIVLAIVLLMII